MPTYFTPAPSEFIPTIHLERKADKLPIHWRGRLLIGFCFVAWSPVALTVLSYLR